MGETWQIPQAVDNFFNHSLIHFFKNHCKFWERVQLCWLLLPLKFKIHFWYDFTLVEFEFVFENENVKSTESLQLEETETDKTRRSKISSWPQ